MIRTRAACALVAALLATVALACGGGDDDDGTATTTTEAAQDGATGGGSTEEGTDGGGTGDGDGGGDVPATTAGPADDTAPRDPESPLRDLLADPAEVGEGYAVDPGLGDGVFETTLCEEVTVEASWEESGSQALSAGTEAGTVIYAESVLAFPDTGAAEAFVADVAEGYVTCLPDMERRDLDLGDEAVLLRIDDLISSQAYALVRVDDRVAVLRASADPGGPLPVDEDLLAGVASRLAG